MLLLLLLVYPLACPFDLLPLSALISLLQAKDALMTVVADMKHRQAQSKKMAKANAEEHQQLQEALQDAKAQAKAVAAAKL